MWNLNKIGSVSNNDRRSISSGNIGISHHLFNWDFNIHLFNKSASLVEEKKLMLCMRVVDFLKLSVNVIGVKMEINILVKWVVIA